MATKTIVVCDICGQSPAQSCDIIMNGVAASPDLCQECQGKLVARSLPAKKKTSKTLSIDPKAVRIWAGEQGIDISPKGRIPSEVLMAYQRAQK